MKKRGKVIKRYVYCDFSDHYIWTTAFSITSGLLLMFGFIFIVLIKTSPLLSILPLVLFIPTIFLFFRRMFKISIAIKDKSQIRIYENGDIRVNYFGGKYNNYIDYYFNKKYVTHVVIDDLPFNGVVLICYYYDHILKEERWFDLSLTAFRSSEEFYEIVEFLIECSQMSKYKHTTKNAKHTYFKYANPWNTD